MDINRIRYFCVVANSGSLLKAAEILFISQPALSKAIHLLETEIGLKLFEREGRGLRLTEEGKKLKALAEPLLSEWLSVPFLLKGHSRNRELRLGSFEVFTTYFVGHLLNEMNVPYFELHEFAPGELEDAVGEGRIDLGITYLPISKPNIKFTEVTKIRMGIYGNSIDFKKMNVHELPFVIPNNIVQGTPSKVAGLDGWPDHKFPRKVSFKVSMMESALELCRQGKAVAYLPEFVVHLQNNEVKKEFELKELDCPIPKSERNQSVFLVQTNSANESPFIRLLAKSLRSLGQIS